jgi:hypothetical protein
MVGGEPRKVQQRVTCKFQNRHFSVDFIGLMDIETRKMRKHGLGRIRVPEGHPSAIGRAKAVFGAKAVLTNLGGPKPCVGAKIGAQTGGKSEPLTTDGGHPAI